MLQRTGTPRRLLGNNIRGASYFTSSYTDPDLSTMNTAGGTPVCSITKTISRLEQPIKLGTCVQELCKATGFVLQSNILNVTA